MSNKEIVKVNATGNAVTLTVQEDDLPVLMKKIGKTTYRVTIHFSTTSSETMSDKIKRMLRNETQQM